MPAFLSLLTAMFLTCLSLSAQGERLRIVTDAWAPYAYQQDGQGKGIDYEVATRVFERLGVDIEWQFLPWKRCLAMLDQGEADGVLDIFRTPEREAKLLFPDEPLSDTQFVLFQATSRPHVANSLADLAGLTIGTSAGYNYGDAFMQASDFIREAAASQEANFGKLVRSRVDLVITDRRVGQFTLESMGLQDQVSALPLVIDRQPQYLAVRRGAGMDQLALRFAIELRRFKHEPAYTELTTRYATASSANKTVEQHESSAL
ncbi:substrate-binding periplasmic protein [Pseudomonas eucalypticola]|uniref:Amino acid ABC transporter substrate-binding protein n=1 Tax=Pseudomonas eucalypticola TaxID=2599595 RepID=A0A7D5DB58_9PSED|nr:transporter substrate-binding domain-containing protein [Pseudomonas eucalypticola]QKZ07218.1 amino acid ABC transporter substrate-binding protein [Pseudomonas eucalypticola]